MWLTQVSYKKYNSGHLHAICEQCFHIFSTERSIVTNILTYCSWMNKNKKPSNKEKMLYFFNAWLLPKLTATVWFPELM